MKHRLTGILFLFCLVAPLAATFSYLHYQKAKVRKVVKHRMIDDIDKEELVLFKFTLEETKTKLRWEHAKEFEYEGQMYDIVEKVMRDDSIYYWCWWDHEETKLNRQLDGLVAGLLGNNPQNREKLINFYGKLYCMGRDEMPTHRIEEDIRYLEYKKKDAVVYYTPPDPPPKNG